MKYLLKKKTFNAEKWLKFQKYILSIDYVWNINYKINLGHSKREHF